MDLNLRGKTAVVTGASTGIGRAIAKALACEGVELGIVARRTELLTELARDLSVAGLGSPAILALDLSQADAAQTLVQRAITALGSIDILVHAAGGSRPVALDAAQEVWDEGMLVNFVRLRQITHAALPGMISRGWGRVINITGTSEPRAVNVANAAKAAVHAWAKGLSREVGKHGITVNSIQPGYILSEQIRRLFPSESIRGEVAGREIPVGRFGEPQELADFAVFLASPRAGYITGTAVRVDGGMGRFAF